MKKLNIFLLSIILTGCQTVPPSPLSWNKDLQGIKEEPINKNIESINAELKENKNIWSND